MRNDKITGIVIVAILTIFFISLMGLVSNPRIADVLAGIIGSVGFLACWMIQWAR